jgi:hypothetical protein
MREETELELSLRVLFDSNPKERPGDVQQAIAARTATLKKHYPTPYYDVKGRL